MEQTIINREATEEENEQIGGILNSMHVSKLYSVACCAGLCSNGSPDIVFLFNSCCGTSAYHIEVEAAEGMLKGLQASIEMLKTRLMAEGTKH